MTTMLKERTDHWRSLYKTADANKNPTVFPTPNSTLHHVSGRTHNDMDAPMSLLSCANNPMAVKAHLNRLAVVVDIRLATSRRRTKSSQSSRKREAIIGTLFAPAHAQITRGGSVHHLFLSKSDELSSHPKLRHWQLDGNRLQQRPGTQWHNLLADESSLLSLDEPTAPSFKTLFHTPPPFNLKATAT